jgi:hypothetical protein
MNGQALKLTYTTVKNDSINMHLEEGETGESIELNVKIPSGQHNRAALASQQRAGLDRARVLIGLALEGLPAT